MSTDMFDRIIDRSQSRPSITTREELYKICECFKQSQAEWKVSLLSTQNMGKVLHKLVKAVVHEL